MQAISYNNLSAVYSLGMTQGRPAKDKRPNFGERIAQARQRAGLTQKQLAEKIGTTQRVLTYWEREAEGLRAEQLAKLSEVLGVSADYFLGRETNRRETGPAGKARIIFEEVSRLPRTRQKQIIGVVEDMLIASNK